MQSGLLHISTHVSNSPTPSGTNKPSLGFADIQSARRHTDRHVGLCKFNIGHVVLELSLWNFSSKVFETISGFLLQ